MLVCGYRVYKHVGLLIPITPVRQTWVPWPHWWIYLQPRGTELDEPSYIEMDFTGSWSHWTRVGGDRTGHPSSAVWQTHSKARLLTCPFVRDFRCLPAPDCLCTLQLLLLKHSSILAASFPLSGLDWGPLRSSFSPGKAQGQLHWNTCSSDLAANPTVWLRMSGLRTLLPSGNQGGKRW